MNQAILSFLLAADPALGNPDPSRQFISMMVTMAPLFVLFYFMMIRPQQQERKKHSQWLSTLKKNDKVVTAGGLIGTIADASGDEITLKLDDSTRVKIMRGSVSSLYSKETAEKS